MSFTSKDQQVFYDEDFQTLASPAMEDSIRDFFFQEIASLLGDRLGPGSRALEVGCGNGMLMEKMQQRYPGCSFEGFDISEKNVQMAAARGLDVRVGDGDRLGDEAGGAAGGEGAGGYDLIYGSAVLHHLQDVGRFFDRAAALLNDGGAIVFGPEPTRHEFIYIIWHKLRGAWEIEKGQLNITERGMKRQLAGGFKNVRIERNGNVFVFALRPLGRAWRALRLSKIPAINDIYIFAEKR